MVKNCFYCYKNLGIYKPCYLNFSFCEDHYSIGSKCPFTIKIEHKITPCYENNYKNYNFCYEHHILLKYNDSIHQKVTRYDHHYDKDKNDKEGILQELYERTMFYIENNIYPGYSHSCWMKFLVARYTYLENLNS